LNTTPIPQIELIQGPGHGSEPPPGPSHRWKVFFGVLVAAVILGSVLVYSRPPVYRAVSSVLTVKPKAVDSRSAEVDAEHVAIQSRLLLSPELLSRLSQRLRDDGIVAGTADLQSVLGIAPVAETNLLELHAEGSDPQQLQLLVNRWTETYETYRAEEIETATGRTTGELEQQQVALQGQIDHAREELQSFREGNEIVGLERSENASLAKLNGLNNSLSKAREKLTDAQSRATAVEVAIAAGETVVPPEQKADIARMQAALARAESRLAELRQRYTQKYIDRDPVLRELPGEVSAMRRELRNTLALARQTVQDEAKQAVDAARLSVDSLERQLAEHQGDVQLFNQNFQQLKWLEANLARLDGVYADNAERLARIKIQGFERFPQIQVVEWAEAPTRPIHPDYRRDLLIALASALGLALFVTWLFEYLTGRPARRETPPFVGVRIQPQAAPSLGHDADAPASLPQAGHWTPLPTTARASPTLAHAPGGIPRHLDEHQLRMLMAESGKQVTAHITLLLSGISPYELPLLHPANFDAVDKTIEVSGSNRRTLSIDESVWPAIGFVADHHDERRLSVADLDARLRQSAQDAGLADPVSVNALAIWHSYQVEMMQRGAAIDDLQQRVGSLAPEQRAMLIEIAPPGSGQQASPDWTHPALRD
jgi:uncharacterized protein involved in exopolysaccharide biosynthesis